MAQTPPKKLRRTRARPTCFSGCFGRRHSDEVAPMKTRSAGGEKLKISWFYWSHFRFRFRFKKSASKTVPVATGAAMVNSTVEAEKKRANDEFNNLPSKSKSKPKPERSSCRSRRAKKEAEAVAAALEETATPAQSPKGDGGDRETTEHEAEAHRNDTRENRTDTARGNTWQNQQRLSFCRKIDAIKAASSQPGSPEAKSAKPTRSSATGAVIPHSASLPILHLEPQPALTAAAPRPAQPQKSRRARPASGPSDEGRGVDSVVGMSIIMVILVIMILWGRLCAILCTAVWCYFVPQLKSATEKRVNGDGPNPNPNEPDLNSEEYKKRVVLEGLLERNRRIST